MGLRRREQPELGGVGEPFLARGEGLLVVEPGFRQCDGPFVVVFFHLMLLLFAGVLFLFALLRFEANFFFRFSALSFSRSFRHLWKARSWVVW